MHDDELIHDVYDTHRVGESHLHLADVAELVDARRSGRRELRLVEVQVLSSASSTPIASPRPLMWF